MYSSSVVLQSIVKVKRNAVLAVIRNRVFTHRSAWLSYAGEMPTSGNCRQANTIKYEALGRMNGLHGAQNYPQETHENFVVP